MSFHAAESEANFSMSSGFGSCELCQKPMALRYDDYHDSWDIDYTCECHGPKIRARWYAKLAAWLLSWSLIVATCWSLWYIVSHVELP